MSIINPCRTASSTAFLASGGKGFYNRHMILDCPSCQARYLISAQLFTAGPRQVRCARCTHEWQAELPKEIDAVGPSPDVDLTPPPEVTEPIPPGSNLPVVQKTPRSIGGRTALWGGGAIILILLAVLGIVAARDRIIEKWPATERIFKVLGSSPINHDGDGLSFTGVRSELRYESGKMLLEVEGKIHNGATNVQEIPDIRALAMGADGKLVKGWQIDAPAGKVPSGEDLGFHSTIDAPKEAVTEINLSFIEPEK